MFEIFKKPKFPTTLFVIASISALIILGLVYIFLYINTNYQSKIKKSNSNDKYYLNENYKEGDLLITKRYGLKDILTGPIITSLDPSQGFEGAPITIVEFSDFKCKYCFKQEQYLKKLTQKYKYKVRLIWKDYPESDVESVSYKAAIAARCAQEQDMFWQYHDFLYDKSINLIESDFYEIAEMLNLNLESFKKCYIEIKPKDLINDNILEADALDISGIPFVYINDQEIMGESSFEELEKIVEIELNKHK